MTAVQGEGACVGCFERRCRFWANCRFVPPLFKMMTQKTAVVFLEAAALDTPFKHKHMCVNPLLRRRSIGTEDYLYRTTPQASASCADQILAVLIQYYKRNSLHTPTRLSKYQHFSVRKLKGVCTNAKLNMANQVILEGHSRRNRRCQVIHDAKHCCPAARPSTRSVRNNR